MVTENQHNIDPGYKLLIMMVILWALVLIGNCSKAQPCLGCTELDLKIATYPYNLQVEEIDGITYYYIDTLGTVRLWEMYYGFVKNYSIWGKDLKILDHFTKRLDNSPDLLSTQDNNWYFSDFVISKEFYQDCWYLLFIKQIK